MILKSRTVSLEGEEQEPLEPTRPSTVAAAAPLSPPLKWAGGKRWQLPYLWPLWRGEQHRRLVEPFCGGLAVVLGLRPRRALLNDVNPHLINFYLWLQRGFRVTLSLKNESKYYYARRAHFNALLTSGRPETKEAAADFYYLNRTGYNGLCRFNRSGRFNVPFGRYRKINYRRDFTDYALALEGWQFSCIDFEDVELGSDDFVYADPPYDVPFTQYSKGGFDWNEQVRTAEWLARHRGPVVLVNQATDRIVQLYTRLQYQLEVIDAPRRISCTGDRRPVKEVFALRNFS